MFAISFGVNSFLCFRISPLPCLGPVRAYITIPNSLSRQKITLFEGRADQGALNTQDGLRILRGLESLLNYYLSAVFVVGHLVRNCTWARRADGTSIVATCVLQRCVGLLVDLAGPATAKMDYVRTICYALLYNTQWHDDTRGVAHV